MWSCIAAHHPGCPDVNEKRARWGVTGVTTAFPGLTPRRTPFMKRLGFTLASITSASLLSVGLAGCGYFDDYLGGGPGPKVLLSNQSVTPVADQEPDWRC